MKTIEVPDYVADDFDKSLRQPNPNPGSVERSLERVYKLIAHTLADHKELEWEVNGSQYFSETRDNPLGFQRVGDKFYIYGEERGQRTALAIFKNDHLAAKYFVWLITKGQREIDWSLFLNMEP